MFLVVYLVRNGNIVLLLWRRGQISYSGHPLIESILWSGIHFLLNFLEAKVKLRGTGLVVMGVSWVEVESLGLEFNC